QTALALALATVPMVVACGDDNGTGTNGNPLVGSWRATSILIDDVEVLAGTSLSLTVTLNSNRSYSTSVSGDTDQLFCDTTTSCTENGTYQYTSTTLTFCDPGCDEAGQYTISGNTVTYVLVDLDLGVTWTMTLVRI
ncbi:MAG: hypothetical protein JSU87_07970, partial [Gemmatimonadota bacterium]